MATRFMVFSIGEVIIGVRKSANFGDFKVMREYAAVEKFFFCNFPEVEMVGGCLEFKK